MAHLSKVNEKIRLRYQVYYPDQPYPIDRSRRYKRMWIARAKLAVAQDLEEKTRYQKYGSRDIDTWRREKLVNPDDIRRLGFVPELKTLGQAIEDYRKSWEVSPKEVEARSARVRRIAEVLGDIPLKNIRYSDGLRMKTELRDRGLKVASIQKHVQDAKRILALQVSNQVIDFNPFGDLRGGRIPGEEKIRHVTLTDREVSEVIARAQGSILLGGHLEILLLLAFGCGLRRGEILSARWEGIDWEERSLTTIGKGGKIRKVGLGRRLLYELLRDQDNKKEGYVFPRFAPWSLSRAFRQHLRSCGIEMRLHDARHTYISLLQEKAGVQPIVAMQRTGHGDMRMLSHYSHGKFGEVFEDRFSFMKTPNENEGEA